MSDVQMQINVEHVLINCKKFREERKNLKENQ